MATGRGLSLKCGSHTQPRRPEDREPGQAWASAGSRGCCRAAGLWLPPQPSRATSPRGHLWPLELRDLRVQRRRGISRPRKSLSQWQAGGRVNAGRDATKARVSVPQSSPGDVAPVVGFSALGLTPVPYHAFWIYLPNKPQHPTPPSEPASKNTSPSASCVSLVRTVPSHKATNQSPRMPNTPHAGMSNALSGPISTQHPAEASLPETCHPRSSSSDQQPGPPGGGHRATPWGHDLVLANLWTASLLGLLCIDPVVFQKGEKPGPATAQDFSLPVC